MRTSTRVSMSSVTKLSVRYGKWGNNTASQPGIAVGRTGCTIPTCSKSAVGVRERDCGDFHVYRHGKRVQSFIRAWSAACCYVVVAACHPLTTMGCIGGRQRRVKMGRPGATLPAAKISPREFNQHVWLVKRPARTQARTHPRACLVWSQTKQVGCH
jgi:hypothetical protein